MATFNKFNCWVEDLGDGIHHLKSTGDTLKVYLSNATPNAATMTVKADLAAITEHYGYAAASITNNATQTSGTMTVTAVDVVYTASGGSFGPFRYAAIYNDTASGDPLIGYVDYGTAITVLEGESFTVHFGASFLTIT